MTLQMMRRVNRERMRRRMRRNAELYAAIADTAEHIANTVKRLFPSVKTWEDDR